MATNVINVFLISAALFIAHPLVAIGSEGALHFYVVSDTPVEDGRRASFPVLGDLGFIRKAPDLQVSEVAAVRLITVNSERRAVEIVFNKNSVEDLSALSRENLGKRMLMMAGGQAIAAPFIHAPFFTEGVIIRMANSTEAETVLAILRRFVVSEGGR